eukprot:31113-Pelagococcus_subviridis.AAC.3
MNDIVRREGGAHREDAEEMRHDVAHLPPRAHPDLAPRGVRGRARHRGGCGESAATRVGARAMIRRGIRKRGLQQPGMAARGDAVPTLDFRRRRPESSRPSR